MDLLRITYIQTALYWQDTERNLAHFTEKIRAIEGSTDLVVLPEMFSTGFTMLPETCAEPPGGPGLQWMQKRAKDTHCSITGSIAVKDQGNYYNRLYWVNPNGSYQFYNKRHLFRMANEQKHYTAGHEKLVVELKGWKICPLVCYDLRFPVWSRNRLLKDTGTPAYDVLLYVANWPEVRVYPWKQLLVARAIENQCYVAGVNRIGEDGNGIAHSGDSAILSPKGELMSRLNTHQESIETVALNYASLQDFRKAFPVMLDADDFRMID